MDSTQDTQTDAPDRAGELDQIIADICCTTNSDGERTCTVDKLCTDCQKDKLRLEALIDSATRTAVTEARLDEAEKAHANAKHLLERSHKWQLTEKGRTDMITGELLLPAEDRVKQLKGEL